MTLKILEAKWSAYSSGDNCPPVLGLAALSEEESEIVRQLVAADLGRSMRPEWRTLLALLHEFPACLAVWLARKAGEAYEAGAFWERFGALIGVSIPIYSTRCVCTPVSPEPAGKRWRYRSARTNQGATLASLSSCTRLACRSTAVMGSPSTSAGLNGILVFLTRTLSTQANSCATQYSTSLQPFYVPTLKRALRGPAGSRICAVALDVVLKGDYSLDPQVFSG